MNRILLSLSLATVMYGCNAAEKEKYPTLRKDYALADALHYDHSVIDALREIVPGAINRLKPAGNNALADALQFEYDLKTENNVVYNKVRATLKNKGYFLFKSEENFGTTPDKFAVLKTKDQFDIIKFRATSGPNYDISTDSILLKLHEWYNKHPFEITGADTDWVEVHLNHITSAAAAEFANEVYEFCPDLTDQGTETVENLAAEILHTQRVFLWWD
jgi:hypothetical protein